MKYESGVCEECGRSTAVSYAHANLCEWCGSTAFKQAPATAPQATPAAAARRPCPECGVYLADAKRERCLDCEVNHAFSDLEQRIQAARRLSESTQTGTNRGGRL
jgi:hypothetical protein